MPAITSATAQLLIALLASYAFAVYTFPLQRVLYLAFVGIWLVPFQVTMLPNYILLTQLGMVAEAEVAAALATMLRQAGAAGRVAIALEVPAGLRFHGGRGELEDMLGNLMENACAWARSRVRVRGVLEEGRLAIEVRDDGPGIPDAELEAVLARGHRLDAMRPGSGLGLAIAATVAEAHGGSLALANLPGGGLCARLDLPGSSG